MISLHCHPYQHHQKHHPDCFQKYASRQTAHLCYRCCHPTHQQPLLHLLRGNWPLHPRTSPHLQPPPSLSLNRTRALSRSLALPFSLSHARYRCTRTPTPLVDTHNPLPPNNLHRPPAPPPAPPVRASQVPRRGAAQRRLPRDRSLARRAVCLGLGPHRALPLFRTRCCWWAWWAGADG
jgi:hypothetical protein